MNGLGYTQFENNQIEVIEIEDNTTRSQDYLELPDSGREGEVQCRRSSRASGGQIEAGPVVNTFWDYHFVLLQLPHRAGTGCCPRC